MATERTVLDREDIRHIIEAAGYRAGFVEKVGAGNGKSRVTRYLGPIRKIELLDEEALITLIAEKFKGTH